MNKAKRRYKNQCKVKTITFYKHDAELLNYANTINFQAFVKQCLKISMLKKDILKWVRPKKRLYNANTIY